MRTSVIPGAAVAAAAALLLSACSVEDSAAGGESAPQETAAEVALTELRPDLAAKVPEQFAETELVMGVSEFPPYNTFEADGTIVGLIPDLSAQLSAMLDIEISVQKSTFDSTITGIESGRYALSAPAGDFVERQEKVDFADFAQSNVTVLVNNEADFTPAESLDLCGKTVGVEKGTGTENVVGAVSELCEDAGETVLEVNAYADKNAGVLALQSNRIDALVAPSAANESVEAEAGGTFTTIKIEDMQSLPAATATYGIMMEKDTGLAEVIVEALNELHAEGTYQALFETWGIPLSQIEPERFAVNGSDQLQAG